MKIGTTNNLLELAPTLAGNFTEFEVRQSVFDAYHKWFNSHNEDMGIPGKYFGGYRLHDSDILSIQKCNRKDLLLRLSDMATTQFACALIDKKKIPLAKTELEFPVEIISSGTKHLSLNEVDIEGGIHPCRFRQLSEFLYVEIIEWQNRSIEIAFDLWKHGGYPNNRFLLLLSCEALKIAEYQKTKWNEYFGDTYDEYYEYFCNELNKGVYLSDYTLCSELIDNIGK
ncbi:hypothetical protein AGMMS49983_21650 [Clostridia bacterium]|nr:hypothetical protein AGMMS49983_21650 [Clostridia bacterium]